MRERQVGGGGREWMTEGDRREGVRRGGAWVGGKDWGEGGRGGSRERE